MATPSDHQPLHPGGSNASTPMSNRDYDIPARKKKCCSGFAVCKFLVILYGFIFFIIGLLLLGVGVWVFGVHSDHSSINDYLQSPSLMALIIGVVMMISAFCAIMGAVGENLCLLKTFLAFIIIVFLVQVIIGIIAYIYRQDAINVASDQLKVAIKKYHKETYVKKGVDSIQERFDCCGLDGPQDWEKNDEYSCGSSADTACSVPKSCCSTPDEGCGADIRRNNTKISSLRTAGINTKGCSFYFEVWVEDHLDAIGATTLGFAIPQILGMFLVYVFIQKVQDRVYLFKYRKRIYQ